MSTVTLLASASFTPTDAITVELVQTGRNRRRHQVARQADRRLRAQAGRGRRYRLPNPCQLLDRALSDEGERGKR